MKKKFVWTKWICPLNSNLNEVEFPGYDVTDEDEDDEYTYMEAEYGNPIAIGEEEEKGKQKFSGGTGQKMISTPFGFFALTDNTQAAKQFDLWVLHTNFDITGEIAELIENVDGVETIDVLTRYRVRIGFPRSGLFKTKNIKWAIEEALRTLDDEVDERNDTILADQYDADTLKKIKEYRTEISSKNPFWALYVLPNGQIHSVTSDRCDRDFLHKTKLFMEASQKVGGNILSYTDYSQV